MFSLLHKTPFLIELFFNGSYILLYSLRDSKDLEKYHEFIRPEYVDFYLQQAVYLVPFVIFFSIVVNYSNCKDLEEFVRRHIFSIIVFFPMIVVFGDQEFTFLLGLSHLFASILSLYDSGPKIKKEGDVKKRFSARAASNLVAKLGLKPAQLVLLSFIGLISVGTILLMLPFSAKDGNSISFVDALFMATSATCVTGLSTLSLSEHFSFFGQIIFLILIQIGGLGYMTLYSSMAILLGRSLDMKERVRMQEVLNVSSLEDLISMIWSIIKFTVVVEIWGGIILTLAFVFQEYELSKAIYYGFFHSVSAFCNAGFSLFPTSLESFATNPFIHGTISVLIIIGGLGFIVLREVSFAIKKRESFARFGLHTKIVLVTSFILTIGGTLFIFFGEYLHALDGYTVWEKIQISFFQSTSLRTAGFNTIPMDNFNKNTLYVMGLIMFIGAAPGSTGGGVKVTTLAILFQSIKSTLKGLNSVEIFDRKIPQTMVVRATALTIISIMISSVFIFILMKVEPNKNFLALYFEVMSAGATVGLSLGITPYLTVAGKIAISILMFVGRTGPLTLIIGIGQSSVRRGQVTYPDGRIMIG